MIKLQQESVDVCHIRSRKQIFDLGSEYLIVPPIEAIVQAIKYYVPYIAYILPYFVLFNGV